MKQNYLKINYSDRPPNAAYDAQLVAHLFAHLPRMPSSGKLLDLACGTGAFADIFRTYGLTYHGVDIDNEMPAQNIARTNIGADIFPFADETFDIIFFKMAIEHLDLKEIAHCMKEIKRVMKPGGAVIILTPDWHWMYQLFYMEFTHQTPFTPMSMRTAIEMSDLRCDVSKTVIQLPAVWRWPALSLVCNVAYLLYPWMNRNKFIRYSKERIVFGVGIKQ